MPQPVPQYTVGVDVSKNTLDLYELATDHLAIACAAQAHGHQVCLLDPDRLSHYRAGIGQRVKADCQNARLLARYLQHEAAELRLWEPLQPGPQAFTAAARPAVAYTAGHEVAGCRGVAPRAGGRGRAPVAGRTP